MYSYLRHIAVGERHDEAVIWGMGLAGEEGNDVRVVHPLHHLQLRVEPIQIVRLGQAGQLRDVCTGTQNRSPQFPPNQ